MATDAEAKFNPENMEVQEDDDKHAIDSFSKGTLQLGDSYVQKDTPGIDRARPGSMIGRQSVQSTSSRTSLKPNVIQTEDMSKRFYSYRQGVFDNAVQTCKDFLKPDLDGKLNGAWLLTVVDHWDLNHERVILLTDMSLFIVRYDFVCMKLIEYKRVQLHTLNKISIGDLRYPDKSWMYDREHGGVRLEWKGETPSFGQLWNPFCQTIPWIVLAHHPLLYDTRESETVTYNVDDFHESLVLLVGKACEKMGIEHRPEINEHEIVIESYAGLASLVFNQSSLGYFKHRGEFKF